MRNLKRNATIGGAVLLAALGVGSAVTAHAASPAHLTSHSVHQAQKSDGDGEVNDATEAHQAQKSDGDGEVNDATETATEINDGPDHGRDANPNQPGHQDANETGETN